MDKIDKEIGEQIRRIVGVNGTRFPVMSGVVSAVDTDDNTCTVMLTCGDDDVPSTGIMLNVLLGNMAGIYGVPAVNANCLVAEVDGPGMWELIKADKYDNVYATAGALIQMNDGSLGGLPVSEKVMERLNKLEQDNNTLKTALQGWAPVANDGGAALKTATAAWYGAQLTETVVTDIENKKITQG